MEQMGENEATESADKLTFLQHGLRMVQHGDSAVGLALLKEEY